MDEIKNLQKTLQKRNFYTIKDSGKVLLYALILPLALGLIFSYISLFIATKVGIEFADEGNIINEMFNRFLWFSIPFTILTQIVFICIYLLYNKFNRISFKATRLSVKKANWLSCLLSALVGIICVFGFIWLIEGCFGGLLQRLGFESTPSPIPLDNVGWLFLNLFLLGLVPAICEELIFRGMIFQGLRKNFDGLTSVLLSALIFALIHQSVEQFIYPFILGCVLAIVFEKTGNIIYSMLIHMFNNFTTIILSYLMNIGALSLNFSITWWGVICALLLAAVTCAVLYLIWHYYLKKHSKLEYTEEGENTQTPAMMVGKMPLTMICGMIICVLLIVINAL